MDYNAQNARYARRVASLRGRGIAHVLVVGCNRGEDCKLFVDMGSKSVTGLDVMSEIGGSFQHPRVTYCKASAEEMPFESESFDLVFCFATMEHVPEIELAFREMARVTAAGGIVFSLAAPLWNSREGHHMFGVFPADQPWIHLRKSKREILELCAARGIETRSDGVAIEAVVDYMLDPRFFNKRSARNYISASSDLPDMTILRNQLDLEPKESVPTEIALELEGLGFDDIEIRALTHLYIARKNGGGAISLANRLLSFASSWSFKD